jgi:hypothetical protein
MMIYSPLGYQLVCIVLRPQFAVTVQFYNKANIDSTGWVVVR